jgi:creatinine amidohydrolase
MGTDSKLISARLSSRAVAEAGPEFALLPVGACEQHGSHLPLATDAMTASHVGARVCEELGGFLLPTLPYGTSSEHRGFFGTITLRPKTLATVVEEVVLSCMDFGVRRLVVLSGHGGNWILRPAVRDINVRVARATVMLVPEHVLWQDAFDGDLHAGAKETSIVFHLDPDAVTESPPDFVPSYPREALDVLPMRSISPTGIWGRPSQASAEEGEGFLNAAVDRVSAYLRTTLNKLAFERERGAHGFEPGRPDPGNGAADDRERATEHR